jgi:hypothetical protein
VLLKDTFDPARKATQSHGKEYIKHFQNISFFDYQVLANLGNSNHEENELPLFSMTVVNIVD